MPRRLLALLLAALLPGSLAAAPPTVNAVSPHGLERGKPVEVTLDGANLAPGTRLCLPFSAQQVPLPEPKPNPARARLRVTVPATTPLGIYPARAVSPDGVSSLLWLAVDVFPNVVETEDNSTPDKAQRLAPPVVVNGQCPGGDVDYFRFRARKGVRLVIETEAARLGSGVVPQIRLTDDRLRFVAADDAQTVRGDCRIVFDPPADGDYLLEFSDTRYRGNAPAHYRIKIGSFDVADEVFPPGGIDGRPATFTLRGGTLAHEVTVRQTPARGDPFLRLDGTPLALGMLPPPLAVGGHPERLGQAAVDGDPRKLDLVPPVTVNGRFDRPGEAHRFQLPVRPGEKYRFAVEAQALGSRLDPVLRIVDQAGRQLALVDDVSVPSPVPGQQPVLSADPVAEVAVAPGTSLLVAEVRDQRQRAGVNFVYRLTVEPVTPDFRLEWLAPELNVPRGGSAALTVVVNRQGYTGVVRLGIPDLPPGYTLQGGLVPAGAIGGLLTVTAPAAVGGEPVPFRVEGTATDPAAPGLKRPALHTVLLSRDPAAPHFTRTLADGLLAATPAEPFTLQPPAEVNAVLGYPVRVPVKLLRQASAEAAPVEVSAVIPGSVAGQPPPAGAIMPTPATAAAKVNEAVVTLTAPVTGLEGRQSVAVQGKAKVNNVDHIVFSPAFTLNVVRPFAVEPAAPTLALPPGQTVPLRFKLARREPFKDAVQVRLEGLPPGVALAAPVAALPAGQSELVANLKVDPKAPPATATVTLSASASINGQPYNHPPVAVSVSVQK